MKETRLPNKIIAISLSFLLILTSTAFSKNSSSLKKESLLNNLISKNSEPAFEKIKRLKTNKQNKKTNKDLLLKELKPKLPPKKDPDTKDTNPPQEKTNLTPKKKNPSETSKELKELEKYSKGLEELSKEIEELVENSPEELDDVKEQPKEDLTKKKKKTKKKNSSKTKKSKGKTFALNFNEVDITEFLNIMSQMIGKNIIMDDKVRGKISIISAKEVPVDQAYNIMKTILEVKGLAVIETKNLVKIVPIKDAIKQNVEIIIDGQSKLITIDDPKTVTTMLELKHAEAKDISGTIKSLKPKDVDVVIYEPLNMLIFTGTSADIKGLIEIVKELDQKIDEEEEENFEDSKGNIHVVRLQNSDAEKMSNVLSRIPFSETAKIDTSPSKTSTIRSSSKSRRVTRSYAKPTKSTTKLSIIASKETNSLIITATPEEYKQIKSIIKKLDTVREQVLIEVLILEVGLNTDWGFGIDWMLGEKTGGYNIGGSSLAGTAKSGTTEMFGKEMAIPLGQGLQLGVLNDSTLLGFVLLNATASEERFNILSTPQILTIDNEEAEINVGEEIPVQSNTRITENNTSFNTWDYKSVGIKLKITPHITNGEKITLDLYQEVNSVLGASTEALKPPILGKRDLKTKITVNDGKTIVVGGLITNSKKSNETKVPILGDIPLLGWFFKRKGSTYTKNNLLIFITPRIVTAQDKIDAVTREKKDLQRRMQKD